MFLCFTIVGHKLKFCIRKNIILIKMYYMYHLQCKHLYAAHSIFGFLIIFQMIFCWTGKIHFADINLEKIYDPSVSYKQSKLANVLFTRELAVRLKGKL